MMEQALLQNKLHANDNADDLVVNLKTLIGIVEHELSFLDSMKVTELASFQKEKLHVLEKIETMQSNWRSAKPEITEIQISELREVNSKLNELNEKFRFKLEQASLVHKEVMNILLNEVKRNITKDMAYSRSGNKDIAQNKMPNVTLNEEA